MSRALTDQAPAFRRALGTWFRSHRRTLPWRETPSLYGTVVSEFMLQQTQIKTALPYFERWMHELPGFEALAAAPESRVMKLWEGLGYYSRARNLHKLAKQLIALPAAPKTAAAWRELPGIGPYTSAAITSIAFGAPEACVDGNVVRILSRLTADNSEFRDSATASKYFAPLAQQLLDPANPGAHNEAMMELGATVCHRQNPQCDSCPVRSLCEAEKSGNPTDFPRLAAKKMEQREVTRVWCLHKKALLLHRASGSSKRLADIHELPTAADLGINDRSVAASPIIARKKRSITRYQITETIREFTITAVSEAAKNRSFHWVTLPELETITLSGPHRRWIRELLAK